MMRNSIFTFFILFVTTHMLYGQTDEFLELANRNQINKLPNTFDELQKKTFDYYSEDIKNLKTAPKYYNNTVLNKFFADKITNYATNTGDLSFNNYFINANTSEGTLTLGKSFRLDNMFAKKEKRKYIKRLRPLQKLGNLLTLSITSDLKNGFSTLYSKRSDIEEYNFNSNIGITMKYTNIRNGKITPNDSKDIKDIRTEHVKLEIEKAIKKYDRETFDKELELENIGKSDDLLDEKEFARKKFLEFYESILDKELSLAKSKSLIKHSHVWWWSIGGFFPLTRTKLFYSTDNTTINTTEFSNWRGDVTGNYLCDNVSEGLFKEWSFKFTGQFSIFNTNSFVEDNISAISFQNIIQDNGSTQVEGNATSVFPATYDDFIGQSVKGELVTLFFNNSAGLSFAIEQKFGEVDNTNWKLGIPFSLKDKDKKPTVNFELQWREINKSHTIGISVGYNFGKFVR
ncbi:hypothetical protein J8L88_05800 [Aquimarina sp. MMG015]|uniref:hypothetical protein n=1 Tax=Aquimarina sp. MMG015 TaxID=2822689 RepID=UPI001B39DF58|nr:hypothetical protein [Aquimarina sp. MMG015]MBQ4802364.1 hypothetical protein [Aquimarina sp. MMG015]